MPHHPLHENLALAAHTVAPGIFNFQSDARHNTQCAEIWPYSPYCCTRNYWFLV